MSFKRIFLTRPAIERLKYSLDGWAQIHAPFLSIRMESELFDEKSTAYVVIGIHSFVTIGDYIFLYEDDIPQACYHMISDSADIYKSFRLMLDHESANSEERIDLYEGYHTTRRVSTHCALLGAGVVMAAEQRL